MKGKFLTGLWLGLAIMGAGAFFPSCSRVKEYQKSRINDSEMILPVTGIKSVTIITPNAEIADAMATPVTIMGIQAGLYMINQMKDIEAIIIDDEDNIYTSDHIHFS